MDSLTKERALPMGFSPWVVHDKALGIPKTDGVVDWKAARNLLKSEGII